MGALFVHSPSAAPIVLPSAGVVAVGHLQCLTTLVMAGWEFRVQGVGFRV